MSLIPNNIKLSVVQMKILISLGNAWDENPTWRFGQLLFNLGIVKQVSASTEDIGICKDPLHLPDEDVLKLLNRE